MQLHWLVDAFRPHYHYLSTWAHAVFGMYHAVRRWMRQQAKRVLAMTIVGAYILVVPIDNDAATYVPRSRRPWLTEWLKSKIKTKIETISNALTSHVEEWAASIKTTRKKRVRYRTLRAHGTQARAQPHSWRTKHRPLRHRQRNSGNRQSLQCLHLPRDL